MMRTALAPLLALLSAASPAPAPAPPAPARLRWQTGQVLVYRVEQTTLTTEQVGDRSTETKTQLRLVKRWQVVSVDPAGTATLQLSLAALRLETNPGGETLLFDSADPDKSSPPLRDQMAKYVNAPLAVLRIDALGRVAEVKESKFGPPSRYENELPFVGVLPAEGLKPGGTWERAYQITLEPPQGAGEKYDAVQSYACKSVADGAAVVGVTTALKAPPAAAADQAPLAQFQPEGEIVYDLKAGRLRSAALHIDKELKGVQAEGGSYRFQGSYTEQYVGDR
jgi:hypothetical protein